MSQPNARYAALKILLRVNEQQGYSNLLLNSTLKELNLAAKDKAFASSLVYGVLERQITLDYIIAHFSNRRLHTMEPLVRNALRLGAYQLIYLDRVEEFWQGRSSGLYERCFACNRHKRSTDRISSHKKLENISWNALLSAAVAG